MQREILGTLQCTDESGNRRYFVRDAAGRDHPVTAGDRLLCRGVGFEWCAVWQYGLSLYLSGPTIHQRLLTFVGADVALAPVQKVVSSQGSAIRERGSGIRDQGGCKSVPCSPIPDPLRGKEVPSIPVS